MSSAEFSTLFQKLTLQAVSFNCRAFENLLIDWVGADIQTPAGRGGRHSRGTTPAPSSANRSFHHESGIFNQAAIDDSVVQESPELHDIPEERESVASEPFPPSIDTRLEREEIAVRQELETLARRRLVQARAATGQTTLSDIFITREASRAWAWSVIKLWAPLLSLSFSETNHHS